MRHWIAGCLGQIAAAACTAGPASDPGEPTADARPACDGLPRTTCAQTPGCWLHQPTLHGSYRCRPAAGPCEEGLVQVTLEGAGADACSARPGCAFVEARCYCPCRGSGAAAVPDGPEAPGCQCECGSGPPATCAPVEVRGAAR